MELIKEEETKKIRENPYEYICNFTEESLPHVGKKTFEICALQPPSEILPNIARGSDKIDPRLNYFHVAGFGTGKSSCARFIEKFTYYPLKRRDISGAELQQRAIQMELMSLIVEDFTQFVSGNEGYEKIKILEGISGEESSVDKSNTRVELLGSTHAIISLFGTSVDLERYAKQLEGGLLSRCILNVLFLTPRQHAEIGKFINSVAGDEIFSKNMKTKEQVIIDYYDSLKRIQSREHEIQPIVGYDIEKRFKDEIYETWKALSNKLIEDLGEKSYIRDLNSYYKFLVCSSFLNVFNRKIEVIEVGRDPETNKILKGSIIQPNEYDHKLARNLMIQTMKNKWALDKAMFYKKNIRTLEIFKDILKKEKSNEVKNILLNISPHAKMIRDKFY